MSCASRFKVSKTSRQAATPLSTPAITAIASGRIAEDVKPRFSSQDLETGRPKRIAAHRSASQRRSALAGAACPVPNQLLGAPSEIHCEMIAHCAAVSTKFTDALYPARVGSGIAGAVAGGTIVQACMYKSLLAGDPVLITWSVRDV